MSEKKIYVIVHPDAVIEALSNPQRVSDAIRANNEINRILLEEEHRIVTGRRTIVPDDLHCSSEILVCGAFIHACIQVVMEALREAGYSPQIHKAGSI